MGFVKEFKEFAVKGSVLDLAIGVIIGGAFGKLVDSMVNDVMLPALSPLVGKIDFQNLYVPLAGQAPGLPLADAKKAGAVLAYGSFANVFVQFFILAFVVFLMVKAMNKLRAPAPALAPAPDPGPTPTEALLGEIRDLLKK